MSEPTTWPDKAEGTAAGADDQLPRSEATGAAAAPAAVAAPPCIVVTHAAFAGQVAGDLSITVGDRIVVTARSDVDWWDGYLESDAAKSIGQFPVSYVSLAAAAGAPLVAPAAPAGPADAGPISAISAVTAPASAPASALAPTHAPAAAAMAPATSEEDWFYKDGKGTAQGPFALCSMQAWYAQGYFPGSTSVKREVEADWGAVDCRPELWVSVHIESASAAAAAVSAASGASQPGYQDYASTGAFNRKTGRFDDKLDESIARQQDMYGHRAKRQMDAYFDTDQWQADQQKPTKKAKPDKSKKKKRNQQPDWLKRM